MVSLITDPTDLRSLILKSTKPLLFKNYLREWKPSSWPLSEWCSFTEPITLRCGMQTCSKEPQWESSCHFKQMEADQFLRAVDDISEEWMYFDYKHIAEWKERNSALTDLSAPWEILGFDEQGINESTIWIGSKGAHTPCHCDTYGFNLVAQIIGRKRWILFHPSDEHILITQTRVPYEESSVYSDVNFFCGKRILESSVHNSQPYVITLEPGDILYVPNKWWHYVEHLTTSLSMNTWVPVKNSDKNAYIDEALIRFLVARFTQQLSVEEQSTLLNPNEINLGDISEGLSQINYCLSQHLIQDTKPTSHLNPQTSSTSTSNPNDQSSSVSNQNKTSNESNFDESSSMSIVELLPMTTMDYHIFCRNKCKCWKNQSENIWKRKDNEQNQCKRKCCTQDQWGNKCKKIQSERERMVKNEFGMIASENEDKKCDEISENDENTSDSIQACHSTSVSQNQSVTTKHLINAFTHPDVISLVKLYLIKQVYNCDKNN